MKLLIDANLSWRLVRILQEKGFECLHVEQTGLPIPASDRMIWRFAKENSLIIVTSDEDFLNLMNLSGFPPKVLLLKTGNQSTAYLAEIILKHKKDIEELFVSPETGLLEIYSNEL